MSPAFEVALIAFCLLASAFFSSSETALLRLAADQVEHDARSAEGPEPLAVRALLRSTSRLLVTILVGNNVVNILGTAVAAALAVHLLGEQVGVVVATVVMTILVLTFGEILPKAVAATHARTVSHVVALPIYVLHFLLRPVHYLFDLLLDPLVRRVGPAGAEESPHSAEQILRLARQVRDVSTDASPLSIIGAAAGAAETTVADVMVPRAEMSAFPVETEPAVLLEQMLEERYTRVPVYQGSIDAILGVVHLKDLIKLVRGGSGNLQSVLRPVLRVPTRKPILRLLADMQRAFCHLAVVKDEFGQTQGMVTQEDILEELVGEIRDEFDREELLAIRRLSESTYRSLARVSVRDFNRKTGWSVPAPRGDTLGGLVFNALGHSPSMGDTVHVGPYAFEVLDVSGNRITELKVTASEPEAAASGGGPPRASG